jgi:hypothetical protein
MEKALELLRTELKRKPPEIPDFTNKPSLALPKSKKTNQIVKKINQSTKTNQNTKAHQSTKKVSESVKKTKPKR